MVKQTDNNNNNHYHDGILKTDEHPDYEFNGASECTNNDYIEDTDIEIQKIKEKTFNKELSGLVDKIKYNESRINTCEKGENISEDELLVLFHNLFYKSVNLNGMNKTNTNFNPYLNSSIQYNNVEDIEKNIQLKMNNLSFPDYAILSYNLEKKCYYPIYWHISNLDKSNIIIDISEELYTKILKRRYGVILDHKLIDDNFFLKKRFSQMSQGNTFFENNGKYRLYFLSFRNLLSNLISDMNLLGPDNIIDIYPYKILMIQIKDELGGNSVELIHHKIADILSIHFLLLEKRNFFNIDAKSHDLNTIFNIIEYFIKMFSKNRNGMAFIIRCKNYFIKENLFTFRYLFIKFSHLLSSRSIIAQITKDKIIILTPKSENLKIQKIINELNNLYGNILIPNILKNLDNKNPLGLLNECLS